MDCDELRAVDLTNVRPFSLKGLCGWARLVDVIDGDTSKAQGRDELCWRHAPLFYILLRLAGIDAPESSASPAAASSDAEGGQRARDRLLELLFSTTQAAGSRAQLRASLAARSTLVWVQCEDFDKYGRVLAQCRRQRKRPSDHETGESYV
jgi:endonuclease YncB( thermonuclease family)